MLRLYLRISTNINTKGVCRYLSDLKQNVPIKEKWDLFAGILVERTPVLSKTLTPMEAEFQTLLKQVEFEHSLKSDHELKHERDLIQAELIKKGEIEIDLDDTTSKQTAQDLKDSYTEEFKNFKFASRITEADKKNDLNSPNRKLEDTLYLVVEQKLGKKDQYILPQGSRLDGETMRQAAERILKETCGNDIKVQFYSNAPCGFFKFKYPIEQRENSKSIGAKVFFFRSILKTGNVDKKINKNFEWLDKESLEKKIGGNYAESVQKFLV